AELGYRLRGGGGGGQASAQGGQDHSPDRHRQRADRRQAADQRAGLPPRCLGDGKGQAGGLGEGGSAMTAPPDGPYGQDPYGTNPYGQGPYWGGQPQGGGYP